MMDETTELIVLRMKIKAAMQEQFDAADLAILEKVFDEAEKHWKKSFDLGDITEMSPKRLILEF